MIYVNIYIKYLYSNNRYFVMDMCAIFIKPANIKYGYYFPISNSKISSNTFTFIYEKKIERNMFIAPISCVYRKKRFVSYEDYKIKLKKELTRRRYSESNLHIYNKPEIVTLKKSNTLSSMDKILQIFSNTTDSFPIPKEHFIPINSYINDGDNSDIINDYYIT